jgi:sarcosine oxidase gamma subunit
MTTPATMASGAKRAEIVVRDGPLRPAIPPAARPLDRSVHCRRFGAKTLDEALKKVAEAKKERESSDSKLAEMQAEAPDLVTHIQEGLAFSEAYAAFKQRKEEAAKIEQSKRETILRVVAGAYNNILALGVSFQG